MEGLGMRETFEKGTNGMLENEKIFEIPRLKRAIDQEPGATRRGGGASGRKGRPAPTAALNGDLP